MKKFFFLLTLISFTSIHTQDYVTMFQTELNQRFVDAVKQNAAEQVEKLLTIGADMNTPISYTITEGDCDWDTQSTALIYATEHNYSETVKVLTKHKKDLNIALRIAISKGYEATTSTLIEAGVNINFIDEDGNTPLIFAIQDARPNAEFSSQAQSRYRSRWQQRQNIIQLLLQAGADITHTNKKGRTALMEAVINQDLHTVQSLLQHPDISKIKFFSFTRFINYADNDGNTALMHAINKVQYLYTNNQEYNICINTQKIMEVLLNHPDIDLYLTNNNGESAIDLFEEFERRTNSLH